MIQSWTCMTCLSFDVKQRTIKQSNVHLCQYSCRLLTTWNIGPETNLPICLVYRIQAKDTKDIKLMGKKKRMTTLWLQKKKNKMEFIISYTIDKQYVSISFLCKHIGILTMLLDRYNLRTRFYVSLFNMMIQNHV